MICLPIGKLCQQSNNSQPLLLGWLKKSVCKICGWSPPWFAAIGTCCCWSWCSLSALCALLSFFFVIHSSPLHTCPAPVAVWHSFFFFFLQRFISCPCTRSRRHLAKSCSSESDDKRQTAHSEPHQPFLHSRRRRAAASASASAALLPLFCTAARAQILVD